MTIPPHVSVTNLEQRFHAVPIHSQDLQQAERQEPRVQARDCVAAHVSARQKKVRKNELRVHRSHKLTSGDLQFDQTGGHGQGNISDRSDVVIAKVPAKARQQSGSVTQRRIRSGNAGQQSVQGGKLPRKHAALQHGDLVEGQVPEQRELCEKSKKKGSKLTAKRTDRPAGSAAPRRRPPHAQSSFPRGA
jgi:hypothetical protein